MLNLTMLPLLVELPPLPTLRETALIMPEIILTLFACAALVLDVALPRGKKQVTAYLSLVGLGFVALALAQQVMGVAERLPVSAFYGMLFIDGLSVVFRFVFIVAAAFSILYSIRYLEFEREQRGEYYALILFSTLGMMFVAVSGDLISLFVSFELMSLSVYVLVGYLKRDGRSNEAAMKYFLTGIFSSALILYGLSLVYGVTGHTNLGLIAETIADYVQGAGAENGDPRLLLLVAMVLVAAGLLFKIAAVPFHMWAPDAYEGAPTTVTAFMSVGPKAGAYVLLARMLLFALAPLREMQDLPGWAAMLTVVAVLTMTIGNLAAVTQDNVKRLLAYSSIAHAGYILLGIVSGTPMGYQGVAFHIMTYTLMNTGVFAVIIALHRQGVIGEKLDDLNGLFAKAPSVAVLMLIFVLGLAGIPATAGFVGKYLLFGSLIQSGKPWLTYVAVIAVLNAVVAFYYYARFLRAMFLNPPSENLADAAPLLLTPGVRAAMVVSAAAVLFFGIYPQPLIDVAEIVAGSITTVYAQSPGIAVR
ncbi:NADH-quinone oxidoreductase subunit N [Chloracidobacterium thermophilum]|uniref:NADH-quinone oxidoreductase subunit N n=1 Tax=Chloracidobacterium thermophilum (strain B) TaxID=981222 RepID=G2LJ08_CHLTF|nr:NADH-quinone oxidoreductase subunit N [Chloracidobacterium thermophilum]AEP12776.1 proton-translocating NADH-quinone oxidoreductase, chain N [Chloracidobacterium thermophilum B]QUV78509.1 NADH-quinone oxidoreductase subunit N [Chloracidobacterium thermophilum]